MVRVSNSNLNLQLSYIILRPQVSKPSSYIMSEAETEVVATTSNPPSPPPPNPARRISTLDEVNESSNPIRDFLAQGAPPPDGDWITKLWLAGFEVGTITVNAALVTALWSSFVALHGEKFLDGLPLLFGICLVIGVLDYLFFQFEPENQVDLLVRTGTNFVGLMIPVSVHESQYKGGWSFKAGRNNKNVEALLGIIVLVCMVRMVQYLFLEAGEQIFGTMAAKAAEKMRRERERLEREMTDANLEAQRLEQERLLREEEERAEAALKKKKKMCCA